jgi:transposase
MSRRKSSSQRKTVLSLAQVGATATSVPAKRPHAGTERRSAAASVSPDTPVSSPPTATYRSGLPLLHRHAAGIDVGSFSHWVCVGADVEPREFPAHTDGLKALAAWLHEQQITTVALESTGIYWVALYELLESAGFDVLMADPSYTKQVKGRPKTDRRDCQWIQRLHAHGLLAAAFRPDEDTCVLRSYLRLRANHVRYAGQHIQHMHKALEVMNVKLPEVVSDITGMTGMAILKDILAGVRDPLQLAKHRDRRCKNTESAIAQALNGSYRDEHLFALEQALAGWQFYQQQLRAVDAQIEMQLRAMKKRQELPPLPPKPRLCKRKANEPRFDVRTTLYYVTGVDLTTLEGIDVVTALVVVSEIGTDMTRWPTVKHFCSWLGLCPHWKKTGGRVKSSRTRPGSNRAANALRLGASTLHRNKAALGAYFRRMKSRLGAASAITATAHKMARLLYNLLRHGKAYVQQTQEEYETQQHERQVRSLRRRARSLGLELVERAPTPSQPAPEGAGT